MGLTTLIRNLWKYKGLLKQFSARRGWQLPAGSFQGKLGHASSCEQTESVGLSLSPHGFPCFQHRLCSQRVQSSQGVEGSLQITRSDSTCLCSACSLARGHLALILNQAVVKPEGTGTQLHQPLREQAGLGALLYAQHQQTDLKLHLDKEKEGKRVDTINCQGSAEEAGCSRSWST